jgi:hypothetical protein
MPSVVGRTPWSAAAALVGLRPKASQGVRPANTTPSTPRLAPSSYNKNDKGPVCLTYEEPIGAGASPSSNF